jgi:hypothetical protein
MTMILREEVAEYLKVMQNYSEVCYKIKLRIPANMVHNLTVESYGLTNLISRIILSQFNKFFKLSAERS